MVSWNDVSNEMSQRRTEQNREDIDGYRREKYSELDQYTERPLIIYATDFLNREKVQACKGEVQIDLNDKDGFNEAIRNIDSNSVDIFLHSPGGLPEATDSLVQIIRSKFKNVRFIIPSVAKSAATMFALSGDRLLMERNAELGPIDPQFSFVKGDGTSIYAPAQAIIDQFEKAQRVIQEDRNKLAAWMPILQQYGPALYQQCQNAIDLSKKYVEDWTKRWMFKKSKKKEELSKALVEYLGDHNAFKSHSARVGVKELRDRKVKVDIINEDEELYDKIMRVYYSISLTFQKTGAFKIFENSRGAALIRQIQQIPIQFPLQMRPQRQAQPQPQQ